MPTRRKADIRFGRHDTKLGGATDEQIAFTLQCLHEARRVFEQYIVFGPTVHQHQGFGKVAANGGAATGIERTVKLAPSDQPIRPKPVDCCYDGVSFSTL